MPTSGPSFGAMLIPKVPWSVLRTQAATVEQLGFDTVWVDDHIVNPAAPDDDWADSWTVLAALAATTRTIRLGTLVSNVILRHPALLARQALTVDQISAGRVTLGIGSGYAETDHRMVDLPVPAPAERARRFRDAVELVDLLLRGEPGTSDGTYPVPAYRLHPTATQPPRPPLVVAASGRHAMGTAARYGDGWSTFGGFGLSPEEHLAATTQQVRMLVEACERIGRDPATMRRWLLTGRPSVSSENMWTSMGAFTSFLQRYQDAGITDFAFYWPPQAYWPEGSVRPERVEQIVAEARG